MSTTPGIHVNTRTVLVTGGAGHIGSALVQALAADRFTRVVVADNLSTGALEHVPIWMPNVAFRKCDVNRLHHVRRLFQEFSIDVVFHFAAVLGVQRTLARPLDVLRDLKGFEACLDGCRRAGVKRIFYSSSSEVYGESIEFPQHEWRTPLNSRLPYAVVKSAGEAYCRSYFKEYAVPYTILRFFNTYGPNQSEDFVVPRFVARAVNGEDIEIYGDGLQRRTFMHVRDAIDVCLKALQNDLFVNDTINVGHDREYTICELAKLVVRLSGSTSQIVHVPALAEGDMKRRVPDITLIRQHKTTFIPLEAGIRELIELRRRCAERQRNGSRRLLASSAARGNRIIASDTLSNGT